jgi:NAD(P)-dependent dehydrogenase (short-subunit alcohol dehydrogenase family)
MGSADAARGARGLRRDRHRRGGSGRTPRRAGAIDTPFLRDALAGAPDPDAIVADIAASHPLGRVSSAEEIAGLVVFLASPRASFVAGAVLTADGGFTAQ